MAGKASVENGRKGGRPPGRRNRKTLERDAQLERLRQRVFASQDPIISGLITNAVGVSYLFKIEKKKIKGPKGGTSYQAQRPVLVKNQSEIQDYLAGLIEEGDMHDDQDPAATYYYITTEKPETAAAKELWDRAFGRSASSIELPGGSSGRMTLEWETEK
jgi:hypothetical protein